MNKQELLVYLRNLDVVLDLDNDGNLDVEVPQGVLNDELIEKIRANKPLLTEYLREMRGQQQLEVPIPVAPPQESYPLSSAQMRVWLTEQMEEDSNAYNISTVMEVPAALDPVVFEAAINAVIDRHEILRTTFREDEQGHIRQFITASSNAQFRLHFRDLSAGLEAELEARALIAKDSQQLYDLPAGPLFRVMLFRLSPSRQLLYFNMHHIISDGWSMNVLERDIMHYYEAFTSNKEVTLPPLEIQYKDYAYWQQAQLLSSTYALHRDFWLSRFGGELPLFELPVQSPRPSRRSHNGYSFTLQIDKTGVAALKEICRQQQATPFMGLLAVLNVLMYRYTGQEDLVIGTSAAGREQSSLQQQIGFYINTLPLRFQLKGRDTFRQHLASVRNDVLEYLQHQDYPFEKLVEDLGIKRDASRSPLFDVMVILHNEKEQTLPVVNDDLVLHGEQAIKYDLDIDFYEADEALLMKVGFNTDIYERDNITRLARHYAALLQALSEQPDVALQAVDYLDAGERDLLLHKFNDTAALYPAQEGVAALFARQVKTSPAATAFKKGTETITYKELDKRSNQLAAFIREQGAGEGQRVAICCAPSIEQVIAILAVIKTGGIYVPVDIHNAPSRVALILQEADPVLIITDGGLPLPGEGAPVIHLRTDAARITAIQDTAITILPIDENKVFCILYTSGSTGRPKGVVIREKSVMNRLHWMWKNYAFEAEECSVMKTSTGFVDHIWELFGPLLAGVSSVIFTKEELLDTAEFIRQLAHYQVTRIVLVPSLLKAILQKLESMDVSLLEHLRYWTCSGEQLSADLAYDFYSIFPDHILLNIYGSTEIMGDATCYNTAYQFGNGSLPGEAIPQFSLSIKDDVNGLIKEFNSRQEIIKPLPSREALEKFYDVSIDKAWTPEEYVDFLRNDLLPGIVNVSSPNYLGHMTSTIPPFIKDLSALLIELNQNLVKIDTSFAGSTIERQVIGMMHKVVYRMRYTFYKKHLQDAQYCLGVVTNGGTISNITALSYALNKALPAGDGFRGIVEEGIVKALAHFKYKGVVVLSSRLAHYSINKAMRTLGLGTSQVYKFEIDKDDLEAGRKKLVDYIERFRKEGMLVLAIIGVAGATETGRIDPLEELADIAAQYGIHFHADAAFGGMLLFSAQLAKKLKGIQRADTVTICGHKQMYLPMGASVCLFRSPDFASFSENNTFYQARKGSYDLGRFSIEGSRSFVSLLFHGALKMLGAKGFSDLMEMNYNRTLLLADKIGQRDNFQITTVPEMNILTYRYIPTALLKKFRAGNLSAEELQFVNELNRKLQKAEFTQGKYFVSFTEIEFDHPAVGVERERVVVLRAVIMNPYTTAADFDAMLDEQAFIAAQLESGGQFRLPGLLLQESTGRFIDKKNKTVPIGKPIANVSVYILDKNAQLLPIGVPGEICIAGDGVAAGYFALPTTTAEKFVPTPFGKGEIMYRTGDIGYWLPDGNIEYIGRTDDQVKIRGNRIELGEIEYAMQQLNGIYESVVQAQKDHKGSWRINAFYRGKNDYPADIIRQQLLVYLPDYMIPSMFIQVEEWPMTASGKINRKALSVPDYYQPANDNDVAPVNETETRICSIWKALLELDTMPGTAADFFSLGGHSLHIMQLANQYKASFGVHVSVKELFRHTTIRAHASLIPGKGVASPALLLPVTDAPDYPVSDGQRRIWILSQQASAASAYILSGSFEMEDAVDVDALQKAVNAIVQRHEILRTIFIEKEGQLRQVVLPAELSNITIAFISQDEKPFQLDKGPLLRIGLVANVLYYQMHHIISDGWSLEILRKEIYSAYQDYCNNKVPTLSSLKIQYRDYAVWQQQQLNTADRDYWMEQLAGPLPVTVFPSIRQRPPIKSYNGHVFSVRISNRIASDFAKLCQDHECSLFMGLMGVLNTLLYRYTGATDNIIGTSVAGRNLPELEDQIGFYINALPLRMQLVPGDTFTSVLEKIKLVILDAFDHQLYPFDRLVDELGVKGDMSHSPLFDIMLILHNERDNKQGSYMEPDRIYYEGRVAAKFDHLVYFTERQGGLDMSVEFNTDIYDSKGVQQLMHHFIYLMQQVAAKPDVQLDQVEYMSYAEKKQLIDLLEGPKREYADHNVLNRLEAICRQYPERIAVRGINRSFSYAELDELSRKIAGWLSAHYQVGYKDLVAIQLERSEWQVPLVWGILKCGAAYVPVDARYPAARRAMIVQDSKCKLVIEQDTLAAMIAGIESALVPVLPAIAVAPADLAYVIYTSGSTGIPKGVAITHRNLYHYLEHCIDNYFNDATLHYKIPWFTTLSFDLTVTSFFGAILSGGELIVYPEAQPVIDSLEDIFFKSDINFVKCTPAHILLLEGHQQGTSWVSQVVVGGEELLPHHIALLQQVRDDIRIYNEYGPTETTVGCTVAFIQGPYGKEKVAIGNPIMNTYAYVLDEQGQLVPEGVTGELCIGGDGVGRGYLYNETLTSAKFIADPYRQGRTIYKTGDKARLLPDGALDYLGRADNQVKVRGYRVEPGEIETALLKEQGIQQAIVMALGNGHEQQLIAWIVAAQEVDTEQLSGRLSGTLPVHMIPDRIIQLAAIPLTQNGKVDRAALAGLYKEEAQKGRYIAPRNATELKVQKIWQEVLKLTTDIGVMDDFLSMGGNSIRLMQLFNRYYRVFGVKITLADLFANSTLAGHAQLIARLPGGIYEEIAVLETQPDYPVSDGQRRIWVLSQMEHAVRSYNLGGHVLLQGHYQLAYLEEAIRLVTVRHEILRTVFRENTAGALRQVIIPAPLFHVAPAYSEYEQWDSDIASQLITTAIEAPFDLSNGPLFRIGLARFGNDQYLLYYTLHHIISDGWSLNILQREIAACYASLVNGVKPSIAPLRIQYKEFTAWQQKILDAGNVKLHRDFWLTQLAGELPVLQMPSVKVRPSVLTYNGHALGFLIDGKKRDQLRALCQNNQATLFMGLIAVLNALLYRYTGQEDIILGTPVAGREHAELEDQIGFYVNTLALRNSIHGEDSFLHVIGAVRKQVIAAFEHQVYPFDRLVEELGVRRDLSRSVLFDVMIMLQNFQGAEKEEIAAGILDEGACGIKFDLVFDFSERANGIYLRLEYNNAIYDAAFATQLIRHFEALMNGLLESPAAPLGEINYLSGKEVHHLVQENNATSSWYPDRESAYSLFRQQVAARYLQPVLVEDGAVLTYGELDHLSNQLAGYLQQAGIGKGCLVPVFLHRSAMQVIAILGIIRTGAAYVPIDPAYPEERVAYILSDSGAKVVLSNHALSPLLNKFKGIQVLSLDSEHPLQHTNVPVTVTPDDLLYVIYTSGSTGMPKGVMIAHTSMVNLVHWHQQRYEVAPGDASTMMAGPGFDASALELWSALLTGSVLHIIPDQLKLDSHRLMQYYSDHHITHAFVPPALVGELIHIPAPLHLRLKYVLIGGDRLPYLDVSQLPYRLVNQYGPTEGTVMVTDHIVGREETTASPIGKPLANTRIYILDTKGNPVPVGVTGEIHIGGIPLARGYWNNEALTAEKFIQPATIGERIYKTGDTGRWLPDGSIAYQGRTDEQVKIRGYRVEPGEIIHRLLQVPGITGAVVTSFTGTDGQLKLAAYYEGPLPVTGLREILLKGLPEYMVPSSFIHLEKLPLTPNGKIDRQVLPLPQEQPGRSSGVLAARDEVEASMVSIVAELLGREPGTISIDDNFFDLGATSLTMVKLVNSITAHFNRPLNVVTLFRYPNIRLLAEVYQQVPGNNELMAENAGQSDDVFSLFEES
ncbi:non-ribosomal peptide synthetase [Chitinophaga sp. LS1]|uniref:non-ribosomal peptide synthetase n=1 Tax=Chitinophaga sp. LS1 TaxID=3051176 RepID=UPI002AAAB812|nr:non-ribosomal peptide synthetase [Chitinophaga sp. LS1]WPV65670.1 amino acid adenylation domain-containing protein [Chitinophaga sp. LS1]